jgi:FkbM family methyltransferase
MAASLKKWVIELFRHLGYEIIPVSRIMPREIGTHLASLFRMLGTSCVFDVGANTGQYRDFLRNEVRYTGLIVSFEPVQKMVEILRQRAQSDPDWLVYHCALGAKTGTQPINVMSAETLSSFLAPDNSTTELFAPYNVVDHTENVEVRTLDSVIDELRAQRDIGKNLYLKMDTQGYDLEVIKGAERSLARIAAVQTELSCQAIYKNMPGYVEMLTALDQKGFQLSGLFPVNQDTSLRIIESDCVMLNGALVKSGDNRLMWTM